MRVAECVLLTHIRRTVETFQPRFVRGFRFLESSTNRGDWIRQVYSCRNLHRIFRPYGDQFSQSGARKYRKRGERHREQQNAFVSHAYPCQVSEVRLPTGTLTPVNCCSRTGTRCSRYSVERRSVAKVPLPGYFFGGPKRAALAMIESFSSVLRRIRCRMTSKPELSIRSSSRR